MNFCRVSQTKRLHVYSNKNNNNNSNNNDDVSIHCRILCTPSAGTHTSEQSPWKFASLLAARASPRCVGLIPLLLLLLLIVMCLCFSTHFVFPNFHIILDYERRYSEHNEQ